MTDTVRLEMTTEQATAVTAALDLANRIALGQIGEIAVLAQTGQLFARDDHAPGGSRAPTSDEIEDIRIKCIEIARILGHRGGSFGVGSSGITVEARRGYEVMKAIQKAVADHVAPGGRTVRHDGVTVRYTQDPAPTASIVR